MVLNSRTIPERRLRGRLSSYSELVVGCSLSRWFCQDPSPSLACGPGLDQGRRVVFCSLDFFVGIDKIADNFIVNLDKIFEMTKIVLKFILIKFYLMSFRIALVIVN